MPGAVYKLCLLGRAQGGGLWGSPKNDILNRIYLSKKEKGVGGQKLPILRRHRDCCAKFATGLCIIVKSAFLFNFLTKFDYKHLK